MKKKPNEIVGAKIIEFRPMTDAELSEEGWEDAPEWHRPSVLVLDNGMKVYPSQDQEGNGPGAFFATEKDGNKVMLGVTEA